MMLVLLGIAMLAGVTNRMLKTNFLFLAMPPAGTPLEFLFQWGYSLYWLVLGMTMLLCCIVMDVLAGRFCRIHTQ